LTDKICPFLTAAVLPSKGDFAEVACFREHCMMYVEVEMEYGITRLGCGLALSGSKYPIWEKKQ